MSIQWIQPSPIGPLHLVASEQGLQGIFWKRQKLSLAIDLNGNTKAIKYLYQTVRELESYFDGTLTKFTVPLDVVGTPFQRKVWDQLRKVPYGKTISYKEVAQKIGNHKAVRAVGTANGRNPISIIIPCHRVIAADGTLGGYAGGLKTKTLLLELERKSLLR